jgi:hypothetical protein
VADQQQIRWYNPKLEDFEWREVPKSDQEALSLLDSFPGCEEYVGVYEEWRRLGAPVKAALIRASDAAREKSEG